MSAGPAPSGAAGAEPSSGLRVLVLGANGPTGRRVVEQALGRGHEVAALTRRPGSFPLAHHRLEVIGGDATHAAVVQSAVSGCDVVISVIGSAFTRRPVEVYSASARLVGDAMQRHGRRRLVVVTSSSVTPTRDRLDQSVVDRITHPLFRRTFGRTAHDDMERMEAVVVASGLDWTIVRPPGLTDNPGNGYATAETWIGGAYCARDDLATMLLDQLDDDRYLHKVAAVATPGLHVKTSQTIWRELLKRCRPVT